MIGVAGRLGDRPVLCLGNDLAVGCISVCAKRRLVTIDRRDFVPQLARAFAAAITDLKSKDLAAAGIQGQPQPLLIGLFTDKTAEFVRFNLHGMDQEWIAALRGLYVKM